MDCEFISRGHTDIHGRVGAVDSDFVRTPPYWRSNNPLPAAAVDDNTRLSSINLAAAVFADWATSIALLPLAPRLLSWCRAGP